MRKVAIFVEGQTELILVREFLLRKYNYEVELECLELFREGNLRPVEYNFSNPNAQIYYQIVKVGNDQKVLSVIIDRENFLFENGFEKVIGLRDMYSQFYRELAEEPKVDQELNKKFINEANFTLRNRTQNPDKIAICFSIMEIEAWFLSIDSLLLKLDKHLTYEFIKTKTGIDLKLIDPEKTCFHPSAVLAQILRLVDISYDKHKGDIEMLCKTIEVVDFENLYNSPNCASFNFFYDRVA